MTQQAASGVPLAPDQVLETVAASEERKKFRRSVGRLDTAFLMLAAIIVLDMLGAVSSYGAQSFTWLIVLLVFFLVPYGLIVAELGTAFPEEGGPYVWVKMAFGRAAAAVVAVMYWVDNPIWIAGTLVITAMATFSAFFVGLSLAWEYVFGLLFIWAAIASVITALKWGKWVATVGAAVRIILIAFFTITVAIYAGEHGVHGFGAGSFSPTWVVFLAAAPILIFNVEGFELPSNASEELKNPQKDVPFAILRSGIATVIFYGVPILLILLVLPPSRLSNVFGFVDAMKQVFVVYGGHVTGNGVVLSGAGTVLADIGAVGVIFGLLSSGVIWLIGSDRTQAVAGFDGAAPRWMGYFSKRLGTPIAVNLLSGVVATIILILSLQLTSGNTAKYFSATLGLVISMVTFTYVLIFPAVIKLRYSHPNVERPYRIPGGMAVVWICGLLAAAWCLLTTLAILWPGIGTSDPDASLPEGFGGQRLQYELSQIVPLAVMILIGLLFYASGAKTRREQVAPAGVPVGVAAGATGAAAAAPAADPTPASTAADTASTEASPAAESGDASPAAGEADGAAADGAVADGSGEAATPASTDTSES